MVMFTCRKEEDEREMPGGVPGARRAVQYLPRELWGQKHQRRLADLIRRQAQGGKGMGAFLDVFT